MMSIKERVNDISEGLSRSTDTDVIQLRALRKAIGYVALALPFVLVVGENLRDYLISRTSAVNSRILEGSISAYFHTGMRELFVGSLFAISVFLVCYKGPQRWDSIAARIAGFSVFLVAIFPTNEIPRRVPDPDGRFFDAVTLFSGSDKADPVYVGKVHLIAAGIFFITLAMMSLFLFTRSNRTNPTVQKVQRNRIFRICGIVMILCIIAIGIVKIFLGDTWNQQTSMVFWLESIAVVSFGISWLTKAEVIFGDESL